MQISLPQFTPILNGRIIGDFWEFTQLFPWKILSLSLFIIP